MGDVNVLVAFYSHRGETERLALAAAVGAVQARANIRLRRLPCAERADTPDGERMESDYVAPRDADPVWADAFIVGTPPRLDASAAEWKAFFDFLSRTGMRGKLGAALTNVSSMSAALAQCGLSVVESTDCASAEEARLIGRRIAEAVRVAK